MGFFNKTTCEENEKSLKIHSFMFGYSCLFCLFFQIIKTKREKKKSLIFVKSQLCNKKRKRKKEKFKIKWTKKFTIHVCFFFSIHSCFSKIKN